MRKLIVILILIITSCTSKKINHEKLNLTYQLIRPKLKSSISDENKVNSAKKSVEYTISLSKEYFPEVDKYNFAQPIIYKRKNQSLNTEVSYFFTESDSIVRLIEYSWDRKRNSDSISDLFKYNNKILNKFFRKKGTENYQTYDWGWQKITSWENDSVYVYQFIFGKEKTAKRTRVIVRFK